MAKRTYTNSSRVLRRLALVACIICSSVMAFSQAASNKGKEFWVGYGHHQFMEKPCNGGNEPNNMNMLLYLSNTENVTATVTVTIDSSGIATQPGTWWKRTYFVLPNTVITSDIIPKGSITAEAVTGEGFPNANFDARLVTDAPPAGTGGSGLFRKKGIHIVSDVPIVAYGHIYGSTSSGATMLLPVETWGYAYTSVNSKQSYAANCYNWMYIVASKDNTLVEITPSVLTRGQDRTGLQQGATKQVTLMKGQIYQLIGALNGSDGNGNNLCGQGGSDGRDLTGTKVRSIATPGGECNPIAVFAGSSRTANPLTCGSGGGDNDNQQLFPQHTWGKRYLTTPFSGSTSPGNSFGTSTYKIVVKDPSTVIRKNGVLLSNSYGAMAVSVSIITASPSTICPGTTATFTALPKNGGPTPQFEWFFDGVSQGQSSNATFTIPNNLVARPTAYPVYCRLWGSAACASTPNATSASFNLTVAGTVTPVVTIYANSESTCGSNPIVFTSVVSNGGTTPTYRWLLNGTLAPGTNTNSTYSLASFTAGDSITCELTSNAGCLTTALDTSTAIYPTTAAATTPSVSIIASATQICPGTPVTFNAIPKNGGNSPTYQWKINGSALTANTAGATNSSTFNTTTLASGDIVTCDLTSSSTCATIVTPVPSSNSITMTVAPLVTPKLYFYASTESLCGSNPIIFTAVSQNAGPNPTYVWKVNTATVQQGTSPIYSTSSLVNGDKITCSLQNATGACLVSTVVNATQASPPAINIITPGLNNNNFYIYESGTADYVEADKPIMIGQFMTGGCGLGNGGLGDPEMIVISPIEQGIKQLGFYRNTRQSISVNYLTLTVPTGGTGLSSLRIANSAVFSWQYPHPNKPGYTVVIKRWAETQNPNSAGQTLVSCDSAFTGIVYGLGSVESYGYNAGAQLVNTNGLSGFHNLPDTSTIHAIHPYTYVKTPVELGGLIAYKPTKMVWKLSALSCSIISPCGTDVTVLNPIPVDSQMIGSAKYYLYRLPSSYTFLQPGTYYIPVELTTPNLDNGNCNNLETVTLEIIVKYKPTSLFSYTQILTGCDIPPVKFSTGTNTPELYPVIKWHWEFTSNIADTSNLQNPSFPFTAVGTYPVKLSLTTLYGGIADTTIYVTVKAPPAVANSGFLASATTLCLGQQLTLTDTTTVAGTTGWYWDFGVATPPPSTVSSNTPQTVTYAAPGTYVIRHTITGTGNNFLCPADTVNKIIVVAVTPNIGSSSSVSPSNCTGAQDGSILLNGLTPGASYGVSYVYNSTTYTPTISANSSGVVTIPNLPAGTYSNITVSIGSCTSNVVGPLTITNPSAPATPTATSNSPVCAGVNVNLSAEPLVNGAIYAWTGPNGFTSASQYPTIPNATTAASGTYSVTVSLNGCVSPASSVAVVVNGIPSIGSTSSTNPTTCATSTGSITLNGLLSNTAYVVSYTNGSGAQTATITSDGSGSVIILNLPAGSYTNVSVSLNTCTSSSVGPFNLTDPNPPATPVASTSTPAICEGSTISLSALSSTGGATYTWTGPNSFTSSTQNPTITGSTLAESGTYSVIATLNSCVSTAATVSVLVKPIPVAPTASSNSPICANVDLNLTAASPTGGVNYDWTGPNTFTSSTQNPTINSATTAATGTYSVTASLNGCTSVAGTTTVAVNAIPAIGSTSFANPSTCATATGSITLTGLLSSTAYTVNYTTGSGVQNATITSNGSGEVIIPTLPAGTYSNVTVAIGACISSAVGPFNLSDPNPPSTPIAGGNSPICEGSSINLTASSSTPGVTYAWVGPNSFTSATQNPSITNAALAAGGTYTVTAQLNGCTSASGTVNITVNVVPAVPTVSSNSPICEGAALNLTAGSTTPGVTYAWAGPNSFASAVDNPTISNAPTTATGTYSVTASLNGCTSAAGTTNATVYAIPAISSSSSTNPTTCATATGSITLNGLLSSAVYTVTYTSGSGAQTASITSNASGSVIIPNLAAGIYSNVTVALNNCTSPSVGPFNLSDPNPPATPVASGNTPICEGSTINLTASSSTPGVTYAWVGPNSFTSTTQNPSITNAALATGGTYTVTAQLNGCTSASSLPVAIVVNLVPVMPTVSSNSPICAGAALNLTANSTTTGVSYAWTGPNSFTSAVQNPTIAAATTAATGTYSVTASLNGCTSAAGTTAATVNAIPAITSSSSSNPTTCATSTGSITLNGLLASTAYTVNYTSASGAQTASITSDASGSVIIPSLLAGSYSNVTVALNNCTSPSVGPFSLSDPNPPATPVAASNTPVCSGSALNLTATSATAGVSYTWTGPNSFTSTTQNPTISNVAVAATGIYSVTATLNSCVSAAGTTTVTIKATPAITTSTSTNPISCATSTGSIALNGLLPNTLYTVSYTRNSSSLIVGLTANASGTVTIANLAAATYSNITVTYNGCTSAAVGPFTLSDPNPPATPTAYSNTPLCNGNTLNLTSSSTTAGVSYAWTGPNSFTSTLQNPSIPNATAAATGTYNVTATLNSCTSAASSVAVVVNTTPNISSTGSVNPANCGASTGSIILNGLAASSSYVVNYTRNTVAQTATISSNVSGVLTIPSLSAGTYANISVTIGICPSNIVGPITLSDPAPPAIPVIAGTATLCEKSALNLTASSSSAGATFAWTSTNGFTAVGNTVTIPTTTTANSGTYTVTATLNNCTSSSTKAVVVNPYPVTNFDTSIFVCMPNGALNLTNRTTVPGNSSITYVWDFGDGSPTSTLVNESHVYGSIGSYTIKLSATSNGCTKDSIKSFSSFFDKPIALFKVSKDTICQGVTSTFTDLSTAPNSTIKTWAWDFGDGSSNTISDPNKKYGSPGNYQISLIVKNAQGCSSDPAYKFIKVYLQPKVDAGQSFMVPEGTTVMFVPTVNDSSVTTTFAWTPGSDLSDPHILRPTLVVLKNQVYTLTMTGEGLCKASDTITVVALKKLGIPNAFSPNGDNVNDKWDITNLRDYSFAIVEVFNRNGQSVFKSYGYNNLWDGTYQGKPLPVGTYYYIIDFKGVFPRRSGYVVILK